MAIVDKQTKFFPILQAGMTPNDANFGTGWLQNIEKFQSSIKIRDGFGTCAIIDSKMTAGKQLRDSNVKIGLEKHLGSHLIKETSFGHKQILSIFRANINTGDFTTMNLNDTVFENAWAKTSQYRSIYIAFVYDITTECWAEVPLFENTSKMNELLTFRHGNYETTVSMRYNMDFQVWTDAGQNTIGTNRERTTDTNDFFWFSELDGRVYFGNRYTGAYVYSPIDPRTDGSRRCDVKVTIESHATQDYKEPRSEHSSIRSLSLKDGLFKTANFTYLTNSEFGNPQAACTLGNRLVYAVGNYLFFSDPGDPNCIVDANVQLFPSRIVAVAPTIGNLLVWTEDSKTYYYNPAEGDIISGGKVSEMSESIGCLGPNAWVNVDGAIIWADKNGFWKNYGNTTASPIYEPIKSFFEKGLSNPLSSYYTSNGQPSLLNPPKTFYSWNEVTQVGVNLSYEPVTTSIYFNIPELNITFVLDKSDYYIWNYESLASMVSGNDVVEGISNMPNPWLLTDTQGGVWAVTDVKTTTYTDDSVYDGVTTDYTVPENAYSVLRLGRGGALDASLVPAYEDKRRFNGEWTEVYLESVGNDTTRDNSYFYIDPPQAIPSGYAFPWAGASVGTSDVSPMWVPISLVAEYDHIVPEGPATTKRNVNEIYIRFKIDRTHWTPYFNANANNPYEIVFDIPTERLGAIASYYVGTADSAASNGVWMSDVGGIGDVNGAFINIHIKGSAGGWATAPDFNFLPRQKNPVILIPLKRVAGSNNDTYYPAYSYTVGHPLSYSYDNPPVTYSNSGLVAWMGQTRALKTAQNAYSTVQSVDWVISSNEISVEEAGVMLDARGITIDVESSGNATQQAQDPAINWPTRLFNVITSTNYKQWAAQLLDYVGTAPAAIIRIAKETVRSRLGTSAIQTKPTFNGTGTQAAKWGSVSDTNGNFLIGDPGYDNIKTSVGVKGDTITVQMQGHVLSPAEKLRIGSGSLVARVVAGFRRRGR